MNLQVRQAVRGEPDCPETGPEQEPHAHRLVQPGQRDERPREGRHHPLDRPRPSRPHARQAIRTALLQALHHGRWCIVAPCTVTSGEPPAWTGRRHEQDDRLALRSDSSSRTRSQSGAIASRSAQGQVHYLRNVMRQAEGDRIRLFNGHDGEWRGTIETLQQRRAAVRLGTRTAEQTPVPDLWLLFAPLKSERTRFVVEKATELGVGAIHPVLTRYGQTTRVNTDRLRAHAIEAAEQCGRLEVPPVAPPCPLGDALAGWPPERRLLVCDPEAESNVADALIDDAGPAWAILVGPEGGWICPVRTSPALRPSGNRARPAWPAHAARRDRRRGSSCLLAGPCGRLAMTPRCAGHRSAMSD